ncbi:MAG: LLM class flavin-dependent oxidoreductase [Candidatus Methanomethylicia archaeon]
MDFGIVLSVSANYASWSNFLSIAREAEDLGYDSIWVSDHLLSPRGHPHTLESWTVLSALAASTKKLRLGTYVLCNNFRHPSLLAKMASTLDNISNGRIEFGIGAGWFREEHVAFGFPWDKHSKRIERLRESLEIIKRLWLEDHVSYVGKYFKIENAILEPKPLQKPHPPIWIGGSGDKIKGIVAEFGDGWIPVLPTPIQLASGVSKIRGMMKLFGRDSEGLQVAYGGGTFAFVAEDEGAVRRLVEPLIKSAGKPIEELPYLIGTPEQCIRKVEEYCKAGADKIVAGFYDFPSLNSLRLFAESVIPCFK